MENKKMAFHDFINTVDSEYRDFVSGLHYDLIEHGCKIEVKPAKKGYLVSYILNKKTIANYVFRKKRLIIRIYANHVNQYMEFLESLPKAMAKSVSDSSSCKRLANPDSCNSKCAMGYDFWLRGEHLQKCRNNAFMFLLCEEYNPFIKTFLVNEVKATTEFF